MIQRKVRLKRLPLLITIFAIIPILTLAVVMTKSLEKDFTNTDFVTETVTEETPLPVIDTTKKMINPYTSQDVTIGKTYYDYQGDENAQINSIVVHDNTYMQNTGIDYVSEKEFEVVAVLEGNVTDVKDDEMLGKIIEIKHDNGYVTSYQSLGETLVKKGDIVNQGQVIGKSGTNELDKDLGNHLHFEIYENSQAMNPEQYLNKEIKEEKEN